MTPSSRDIQEETPSFDGIRIVFDWHPIDRREPVLVVPGFWRIRRDPSIQHLLKVLVDERFSAAAMDLRGHGESGGRFAFNRDEWRDVVEVARRIATRGSTGRVAIVGFSLGASIAISAAAERPDLISRLVLVSPVADIWKVIPRPGLRIFDRHLSPRLAFRPPRLSFLAPVRRRRSTMRDMARSPQPILLLHTPDDWLVSAAHSRRLLEASSGNAELRMLPLEGGYHADRIFWAAPGLVENEIVRFLRSSS